MKLGVKITWRSEPARRAKSANASTSTAAVCPRGGIGWRKGGIFGKAAIFGDLPIEAIHDVGLPGRYSCNQPENADRPSAPAHPEGMESPFVLPTELHPPPSTPRRTYLDRCTSAVGTQRRPTGQFSAAASSSRQKLAPPLQQATLVSPLTQEELEWVQTQSCTAGCLPVVSDDDDRSSRLSLESSSTGTSLESFQEKVVIALKNRDVHVVFAQEHLDTANVVVKPGTRAICIVAHVPSTPRVQEMVRTLMGQQAVLPKVVMLLHPKGMSSSGACTSQLVKETELFFEMGVDDVLLQPSSDYDLQETVDMCLCRLDHWSSFVQSAATREANLIWKSVHRIFPNLPRLSSALAEPAVGGLFGNGHEVIEKINFGKTSTVYLLRERKTNTLRALKAMPKAKMENFNIVKDVDKEVSILKKLNHPNIVALLGEAQSAEHLNLLMEFAGHRNLFKLVRSEENGRLSAEKTQGLFMQVVDALRHCHSVDVAHNDVKPENIAICNDGVTAKLVDFGFADNLAAPLRYLGTMPFVAPEMMMQDLHTYSAPAADVWALGIVLVEMLCGVNTLPQILGWQNTGVPTRKCAEDVIQLLSEIDRFRDALEARMGQDLSCNGDFMSLLNGMLCVCVAERWEATRIQMDPWLAPDSCWQDF